MAVVARLAGAPTRLTPRASSRFVVPDEFATAVRGDVGEPAPEDAIERVVRGVTSALRKTPLGGEETSPSVEKATVQQSARAESWNRSRLRGGCPPRCAWVSTA